MTVVHSWKQILLLLKIFRTNLESQSCAAVDCVFGSTCSGQVGSIFWGIHERRCESAPPLGWPLLSGQVDLLSLSPETSCLKEQHQTICSSLGFILTYMLTFHQASIVCVTASCCGQRHHAAACPVPHFHCKSRLKRLVLRSGTAALDPQGKNLVQPRSSRSTLNCEICEQNGWQNVQILEKPSIFQQQQQQRGHLC